MFEDFVHAVFWPFFLGGLVGLMSISNPLSKIPLFVSLTQDMSQRDARRLRAGLPYGFALLVFTLFFGVFILGVRHFVRALRIAGGLTVALLGYHAVRPRLRRAHGEGGQGNIAVFWRSRRSGRARSRW
jgi:multiple antibiotic resistance protein